MANKLLAPIVLILALLAGCDDRCDRDDPTPETTSTTAMSGSSGSESSTGDDTTGGPQYAECPICVAGGHCPAPALCWGVLQSDYGEFGCCSFEDGTACCLPYQERRPCGPCPNGYPCPPLPGESCEPA